MSERKMKDSGIDWANQVPEHWTISRIKNHLTEINEKNNPLKMTKILSLTNTDGVIPYSERGNQGNKAKEDLSKYKVVYKETIVANSMNILIGSVGLSEWDGCVSPVYYVYKAKKNNSIRYFNYLFSNTAFQEELRKYGYEINRTNEWDRDSRDVVYAFQLHFNPKNATGNMDLETFAILKALNKKYPN